MFSKLEERWARDGINSAGGATPNQLAAFEREHDVVLPSHFRDYFLRVNGFDGGSAVMDSDLFSFWNLSEVEVSAGWVTFADWSIDAYRFAFCATLDDLRVARLVAMPSGLAVSVIAPDLPSFLGAYLQPGQPELL